LANCDLYQIVWKIIINGIEQDRYPETEHKERGLMATMIISGSRGTDDPTMATLPFMAAKTAKDQGHNVVLWLWNEAVTLGRKGTADHVIGVNLTPLKDLLAVIQGAHIPIWVCGACAVARQIQEKDLITGAAIKGMPDYIQAVAELDRSISF
jgi:predicted peroxiredoxin